MAEPATATTAVDEEREERRLGDVTVLARDLHVHYRVYADRRPSLREVMARRGRRPSYQEVRAVQGVDLTAHEGESIGLIGRNGSGKSTLLQAVAGLLPASRGQVYARSQPSLLGVSAALQKSVSGRRNIILGGLALGMSREDIEEQMDDIIEWTGLEEFIDLPLRTYSSGMRARLHFAISTAVEPEILLIDEALSVGDEVFKERSKERIGELLDNAGTVFICSHSMGTIRDMCSRVVWLEGGRIEMDGEPRQVISAYKERYQLKSKKKSKKKARKKARAKRAKRAKRAEQRARDTAEQQARDAAEQQARDAADQRARDTADQQAQNTADESTDKDPR